MEEKNKPLSPTTSSPPSEDTPMDDAVQSSGNSGDEEAATNQPESPIDEGAGGGGSAATSNLAKFKATQDLRIQTANLPSTATEKTKPRAHSEGSSTGLGEEDGDEGSVDGGKTPVPAPCSTGKKRRRRTAAQIDRKFPCTYPGCTKAYGSEGSLTQHQRLKHRNQSPEPGVQATQLNNFFLPLHRTPRGLAGSMTRPVGAGGARTVTIRPAGIDGLTLHNFDVAAAAASLLPEPDSLTGEFLLPVASPSHALNHARQQLRARSNSMPISFSTSSTLALQFASPRPPPPPGPLAPSSSTSASVPTSGESTPSSGKPKAARRSRQASTPRSGGKPPLRRNKCRSKSESLQDAVIEPLVFHDEIRLPSIDRSTSDNAARGFSMTNPGFTGPQFDWRFAVAQSQHSDSPVSSVEEAIDSDILSVLADYDTSDTGDSTLELVGSSTLEDALESSHASSSGVQFPEPEDEWLSQQDAQYLTTHLEKMSMLHESPPGSITGPTIVPEDDPMSANPMTLLEAETVSVKQEFPVVLMDTFTANVVDPPFVAGEDMKDGLKLHGLGQNDPSAELLSRDLFEPTASSGFKQEPEPTVTSVSQSPWTKQLAALETYSSSGIDQADFMDVDSTSYGPLQFKSTEKPRSTTSQALFAGSFDSLTSYLQHGDKHGTYATLGDTFAIDNLDYAMEEPRLSSPVVCQQKDL